MDKKNDDLHAIQEGIKRVSELFEMRCEDHAELTHAVERLLAISPTIKPNSLAFEMEKVAALVKTQKAKWHGLDEPEKTFEVTQTDMMSKDALTFDVTTRENIDAVHRRFSGPDLKVEVKAK